MTTNAAVNTSAGSKLFIGTTAADASSDTYAEISEVTSISGFGRSYDEIRHSALGDRNVRKFKGQRDDGNITVEMALDADDTAQASCQTALDKDQDYNFKVTLNDDDDAGGTPTLYTFKAKVMSFVTNVGGPNNVVTATMVLGIKSNTITKTAATAA